MSEHERDTAHAAQATKAIFDGRDHEKEAGRILVTLEHTIAVALLFLMKDPRNGARMLNEGLVPGVERRLSDYEAKVAKS